MERQMELSKSLASFLLLAGVLMGLVTSSVAYDFYVGGRDGWVSNPSESYGNWAGRNRFQVNDTLVFKYRKGVDSVLVVTKQDYDACNASNPIQKLEGGDSAFKFDRSGPFYFISGVPENCRKGQKLQVVVLAGRNKNPSPSPPSPPPTTITPSPSPSKSPTSSPASSPSLPPSPSSSASSPSPSPGPSAHTPISSPSPSPSPSPSITSPTAQPPASGSPSPNAPSGSSTGTGLSPTAPSPPSPSSSSSVVSPSRMITLGLVPIILGGALLL